MRKWLIPFLAGVAVILLIAAQPKIGTRGVMLEQDGFGTNTTIVTGKSLAATNVIPLNATANRPAFINASGGLTNVSGTPNGLQYVRDDGVLAVPSGGGVSAPLSSIQYNSNGVQSGSSLLIFTNNAVTLPQVNMSGNTITNATQVSLRRSQSIQPLVGGIAMGDMTNNWSEGNDTNSPYRFVPLRGYYAGNNNQNLEGYKAEELFAQWGLEGPWFNPGLDPVFECWFRLGHTNASGTVIFRNPWGYDFNLVTGNGKQWLRANQIIFNADNFHEIATLTHNGTNGGLLNFEDCQLSFFGSTNKWHIISSSAGFLGKPLGPTNYLFEGSGSNERLHFFEGSNPNGSDMRIGFSGAGVSRYIRWQGTNSDSTFWGWEYQDSSGNFRPFQAAGQLGGYIRGTNVSANASLGSAAGSTRTLGYVTNSEAHTFSVQFDVMEVGEGTHRFLAGFHYSDQTTSWKELMPLMSGARSATEGRLVIDCRLAPDFSNKQEFRLRRTIAEPNGAGNVNVAVQLFSSVSAIWVSDTSGSGTGTNDGGIFHSTPLTTVRSKVGILTNNPISALHVGSGGSATIDGSLTSGTLTNLGTANIPTNTASFSITTTDFVINTWYTNDAQRASVVFSVELDANATGTAKAGLYIDQAVDGTFETTITVQSTGLSDAVHHVVTGWLQPGARFAITNLSSGTGSPTATVVAGSSQWVKQ